MQYGNLNSWKNLKLNILTSKSSTISYFQIIKGTPDTFDQIMIELGRVKRKENIVTNYILLKNVPVMNHSKVRKNGWFYADTHKYNPKISLSEF